MSRRPHRWRLPGSGFSIPIVVSLVYVGVMVLTLLAFRTAVQRSQHGDLNPIVVANQVMEAQVWLASLSRISTLVSVLLVIWLWVWCRPRVRRLGGVAAWPYLGVAALLAATHLMVHRALAALPGISFELIQVWP